MTPSKTLYLLACFCSSFPLVLSGGEQNCFHAVYDLWNNVAYLTAKTSVTTEFTKEYLDSDPSLTQEYKHQKRFLNLSNSGNKFKYDLQLIGGETGLALWDDVIAYDGTHYSHLDRIESRITISKQKRPECHNVNMANSAITLPFAFMSNGGIFNHALVLIDQLQSSDAWNAAFARSSPLPEHEVHRQPVLQKILSLCYSKKLSYIKIESNDTSYADWVGLDTVHSSFPAFWVRIGKTGDIYRSYVVTGLEQKSCSGSPRAAFYYPKKAEFHYWDGKDVLWRTDYHEIDAIAINDSTFDESSFFVDPTDAKLIHDIDHNTIIRVVE